MRTGVARALANFSVPIPGVEGEFRFIVEDAATGEEAIDKINGKRPDILLLDHKLPGISGLDVLEYIAQHHIELLTIMITAYASIETAVRATKQGAYDFLAKPFTPAELKNAVRKAAEHIVIARHAKQLAEEKRQVRFQFISVLAHELKSPLGAVEGYLDILKDRSVMRDEEAYNQIIGRCASRMEYMQKMIGDLLDLTRIESGQKVRNVGDSDLTAAARSAIESIQPDASQRDIQVALRAPDSVFMRADQSELEIIFNNLVSNAVKYNKDGGKVDVSIEPKDGGAVIRVSDTGIGMTQEEAARLFQDFVRIRNKKTKHIYGSGLGLSIVKKLAQLYGGSVSVESKPDTGSTFTVELRG
jgi:signal transduction histidine kinase